MPAGEAFAVIIRIPPPHAVVGVFADAVFPQGEVCGIPFLVAHRYAGACFFVGYILPAELSVAGEGGGVEVDTVGGFVGVALLCELIDEINLFCDVGGGAGEVGLFIFCADMFGGADI